MKLSCPHCDTSLEVHVDPTSSGARPVECAACGRTFHWSHKDSTIAAEALVITSEEIPYPEVPAKNLSSVNRSPQALQKESASSGVPISTALLSSLLCGIVGWWLGAMGIAIPPGPTPYGNAPPIASETSTTPSVATGAAAEPNKSAKPAKAPTTPVPAAPLPKEAIAPTKDVAPTENMDAVTKENKKETESKVALLVAAAQEPENAAPIPKEKAPTPPSQSPPQADVKPIPAPQITKKEEEPKQAAALEKPTASSKPAETTKKKKSPSKSTQSGSSGSYDSQMREARKLMKNGSNGAIRQALSLYKIAAQKTSSVEPIAKQGDAHLKLAEYGKAIENYQRAIQKNPSYRAAHIGLARAYRRAGNLDKARNAYQGYLERFPDGNQAPEARSALNNL